MESKLDTDPRARKRLRRSSRFIRIEDAVAVEALVGVEIVARDVLPQDAAVEGSTRSRRAGRVAEVPGAVRRSGADDCEKGDRRSQPRQHVIRVYGARGVEAMPLGLRDGGMRLKQTSRLMATTGSTFCFPTTRSGCIPAVSRTKPRWS